MKYNELSHEAQEKARNECKNNLTSYEWWDDEYSWFKEVGESFGLRIDDIYWSGFWSQGDGASFKGMLAFKETDPTQLPEDIRPIYTRLKEMHAMLRLALEEDLWVQITQSGREVHEYSMDVDGAYWKEDDNDADRENVIVFDFYEEILELMRDYARWMYSCLESQYDFDEEGNWL